MAMGAHRGSERASQIETVCLDWLIGPDDL
jgi:hypothetical protein